MINHLRANFLTVCVAISILVGLISAYLDPFVSAKTAPQSFIMTSAIFALLSLISSLVLGVLAGSVSIFLLVAMYHKAAFIKYDITYMPLTYGDILGAGGGLEFLAGYMDESLSYMVAFFGFLIVVIFLSRLAANHFGYTVVNRWKLAPYFSACLMCLVAIVYLPAGRYFVGMHYEAGKNNKNVVRNGSILTLIMSANVKIPDEPAEHQLHEFKKAIDFPVESERASRFVFISCESCWYDDGNFKKEFDDLLSIASYSGTYISPQFGGGTPNVSLEVISGIPVRTGGFEGVFLNEFAPYLAEKMITLPSILQDNGYRTASLHNWWGDMFSLSTIKPKYGYDEFYSLDNVKHSFGDYYYPRDSNIYDAAIDLASDISGGFFIQVSTMFSHGPYRDDVGDGGYSSYGEVIDVSVGDMVEFIERLQRIDPSIVVLVLGDHKPGLHNLFKGLTMPELGRVPYFIIDSDKDRAGSFHKNINGKPAYCVGYYIGRMYFDVTLLSYRYTANHCASYTDDAYNDYVENFPSWIQRVSLFDGYGLTDVGS